MMIRNLIILLLSATASQAQIGIFEDIIKTTEAEQVADFGGDIGGDISLLSTDPIATKWGLVWNDAGEPSFSDNSVTFSGSTRDSTFTYRISSIPQGDILYYKAYIVNADGVHFGQELSFVSIPTLGETGIALLITVLAGFGIYFIRRTV